MNAIGVANDQDSKQRNPENHKPFIGSKMFLQNIERMPLKTSNRGRQSEQFSFKLRIDSSL